MSSAQHSATVGINWSQVAGAGYKFAFVKAAEGNYYLNKYAAADLAQASAAGLYVAPYDFAIPNVSGGALQADYALDHSALAPGAAVAADDPRHRVRPEPASDHANECYDLTPAQTGVLDRLVAGGVHPPRPGSTRPSTRPRTGGTSAPARALRSPATRSGSPATPHRPLQPIMPPGWKTWTYWQYGTQPVPGISGQVDVSYLSATRALRCWTRRPSRTATGTAVSLPVGALTAADGQLHRDRAADGAVDQPQHRAHHRHTAGRRSCVPGQGHRDASVRQRR